MARVGVERARRERGAAAVEFGLILPFLMLLIFGLIDFGRMLNMQIALTQAAREGVRVVALGGNAGDATARTQQAAFPVTAVGVAVSGCPTTVTPTTPPASVTVSRQYNWITPVQGILNVMGQPALATPTVTGIGRMRCSG